MCKCRIILSTCTDPFFNLALEEFLVRRRERLGLRWCLLSYRNAPSVIVGRNQNPWLECRVSALEAAGVPAARRISGGGAVYHDLGNLNFSLIGPRREYRPERHAEMLRRVLDDCHVRTRRDDRQSLYLGGRKVSGSAFMLTGKTALQHSTLLVRADLDRLRDSLRGGALGIETRAQRSRPAPVANLCEAAPAITWDRLQMRLIGAYSEAVGCPGPVEMIDPAELVGDAEFGGFLARHRSWEWRYGRTPGFTQERTAAFPFGRVRVEFKVRHGLIERGCLAGPVRLQGALEDLAEGLTGRRFDPACFREQAARVAQRFSAAAPELAALGPWLEGGFGR
ncbi:MAG: hypothetical protein GXP31_14040 [Kiritimatiellaeota bacterium]|nr:hypothetical protein [Kiritimatiellota bacterium]